MGRFAAVFREHHAFVWQALPCLGVVDSALEDAVLEVFVVVHRRLDEFEGRAKLRTWIFETARSVATRYRTQANRDAARTFELPDLRREADVEAALERALALETVRAFLDRLDEDRTEVFMLAEFGELPAGEVAETLGVDANTVDARLQSARAELDSLVARLDAGEGDSIVGALRRGAPPPDARGRTWTALVAELGLAHAPAPAAATQTRWLAGGAVLGIVAGAATLAAGVILGALAGASSDEERSARPDPPVAAASVEVAPALPEPAEARTVDVATAEAPDDSADTPSFASGSSDQEARPVAVDAFETEPPSPQLGAEVRHVQGIRSAVERGNRAYARTQISVYRQTFKSGALRPEVDALAAELRCTSKHRQDRASAVKQFARQWPGSPLIDRLRRTCRNGPRSPGNAEPRPM